MKYTLMHKNIAVADVEIDEAIGGISVIDNISAKEHLPIGVVHPLHHSESIDRYALNQWWAGRSIPASRMGVEDALEKLGVYNSKLLLTKCLGLSLSDHYWIKPYGSDMTWEDVNFFDNDFSDDIGDVLFGTSDKNAGFDFLSPDNTSDGNLKKRWKIIDGKRCLLKSGSNLLMQQPFNEVIASRIMDKLGIDHVPYIVTWINDEPYSVCEDFVTENTELIPAWRILKTQKKDNSTSVYQHFVNCCESLGIKGAVPFLDRMIVLDYIIANEDRHLNNFGVIRNAETLEWLGFAPIYDSGSSLGYDKTPGQIRSGKEVVCKPFKNHHAEQLKLVSDFSWINFDRLTAVKELITSVLTIDGAEEYMDDSRIRAIAETVNRRIQNLLQLSMTQTPVQAFSTEDDVEKDIAEDYTPKMEL